MHAHHSLDSLIFLTVLRIISKYIQSNMHYQFQRVQVGYFKQPPHTTCISCICHHHLVLCLASQLLHVYLSLHSSFRLIKRTVADGKEVMQRSRSSLAKTTLVGRVAASVWRRNICGHQRGNPTKAWSSLRCGKLVQWQCALLCATCSLPCLFVRCGWLVRNGLL